ncbi:asparaginase [Amycolatopsis rubida]|uniref:Asparaginase n=1 Tax=Amycolatopsis rubida TaxID=112413 RepID=A0ABX0C0V7_9PSEU|nr:asparaginase [Amycolatopsis sp. M39]MYW93704.1 asparaginase [Amycolatopsis rubida]NEC58691.1 asparaginase [Amycolatopsis rubida]OAP21785.1 L-asparaginase II [Amycolatopsis sp. M39]
MIPQEREPRHVPLVHLLREGMVEGVHHGSVVVLSPDGSTLFEAGDPDVAMYPRSTAKPLQAAAMARLGLRLGPSGFAIAAASHSGEPRHLEAAAAVLASRGFAETDLGNPADLPYDPIERDAWIAGGRQAARLAHNCSGKHAAMLAVCQEQRWDIDSYLDPAHPLQRAIRETVEELTGQTVPRVATDGCGAPLFALSLRGLARAASQIATAPEGSPESLVATGIRRHPDLVAGSRRDVTRLMRAVPGLIAKDGFEAVQLAALPNGTAVALKIADGGDRARPAVLAAALARAGVGPELLAPFSNPALRVTDALAA